jgi:hypothetical protein
MRERMMRMRQQHRQMMMQRPPMQPGQSESEAPATGGKPYACGHHKGGMMMGMQAEKMQMMRERMEKMEQHMQNVDKHLSNIEALLKQMVEKMD